jgi:hypothetical protein
VSSSKYYRLVDSVLLVFYYYMNIQVDFSPSSKIRVKK